MEEHRPKGIVHDAFLTVVDMDVDPEFLRTFRSPDHR